MSTTYQFTYFGDEDAEEFPDFTVEVDKDGDVVSSTNKYVQARKGSMLGHFSNLRREYLNHDYEITKADDEEEGDEEEAPEEEEEEVTVAKIDPDKRLVYGWAYVSHDKAGNVVVDKSGEFIDDHDELEKGAYDFVVKSRKGRDHHGESDVGTLVESMVFTPEKVEKMGLPAGVLPTGWWVGFRIDDDEVWKAVKDGKRTAFSIHGRSVKTEV